MSGMGRREFVTLLGGAAAAWPLAARAQQSVAKARRLGLLLPGAPPEPLVEALLERLRELGYREGRDVVFELRWAQGKNERLTELASELVAAKVDVITTISTPAALAARKVTTTIPIVFTGVGDPLGAGVVSSLSHPDGNATGLSLLATELSAKRLSNFCVRLSLMHLVCRCSGMTLTQAWCCAPARRMKPQLSWA
jgi:ABC transporter substrate binding protein